jgi:hypothetical protein
LKPILLIATLVFGQLALADEAADRAAIGKLIATLNDRTASHAQLYTSDSGDSRQQIEQITDRRREPPMSELSQPFLVLNAVRFITPDVALVDATSTQYGSLYARRLPVLLIMRKSQDWQIAVVRSLPNLMVSPGMNLVDLKVKQ